MTASPSLDRRQLDALMDRLNNTACVVTTAYKGQLAGCFVTFVTGCSLEPPRLLVLTSHENLTHELVKRSGVMTVHLVPRGREEWIRHFGYQSGRDVDKFANLDWEAGVTGSPILPDALGHVEGRVLNSMDCGDHTARLLEPVVARLRDFDVVPLTTFEILARGLEEPRVPPAGPWTGYNSEQ